MSKPLFSFGLITDVQYADIEDGMNYRKTRHRYYRKALKCLQQAFHHWTESEDTSFVLQLGDILDGFCRRIGKSSEALSKIKESLIQYKKPIAHCWGNHELYNFGRNKLMSSILMPKLNTDNGLSLTCKSENSHFEFYTTEKILKDSLCCYHFAPYPGFRFIVLDCYDISALGREEDHPKAVLATDILDRMNPCEEKNDHRRAVDPKYVKYNGGIGTDQLEWLENVLKNSQISLSLIHI